jgi:hypothetical protein
VRTVLLAAALLAAPLSGINVPERILETTDLDELLLRSRESLPVFPGTRPFIDSDLERSLRRIDPRDGTADILKERILSRIGDVTGPGADVRFLSDSIARLFATPSYALKTPLLSIHAAADFKFGESEEYPNQVWRDLVSADYVKGYAQASLSSFRLLLGRESIRWGPSPVAPTLLSYGAPALDGLVAQYLSSRLKFSFFASQLETLEDTVQRFLSGHRLEIRLLEGFYLGVSETVIQGVADGLPDFYFFNPLLLYYLRQWNRDLNNDNILWGIDLNWYGPGIGAYLDLTVDDFPYESPMNEHPKVAFALGIRLADPLGAPRTFMTAEYSASTKWTYGHYNHPWLRYTHLNVPLGRPEGNDFDLLTATIRHHLNRRIDLSLGFRSQRKGEGVLDYTWPAGQDFPDEYFLTGIVEHSHRISLGFTYFGAITVHLDAGYAHVSNLGHVEDATKDLLDVTIRLQAF